MFIYQWKPRLYLYKYILNFVMYYIIHIYVKYKPRPYLYKYIYLKLYIF